MRLCTVVITQLRGWACDASWACAALTRLRVLVVCTPQRGGVSASWGLVGWLRVCVSGQLQSGEVRIVMANWVLLLELMRVAAASMEMITRALERLHVAPGTVAF